MTASGSAGYEGLLAVTHATSMCANEDLNRALWGYGYASLVASASPVSAIPPQPELHEYLLGSFHGGFLYSTSPDPATGTITGRTAEMSIERLVIGASSETTRIASVACNAQRRPKERLAALEELESLEAHELAPTVVALLGQPRRISEEVSDAAILLAERVRFHPRDWPRVSSLLFVHAAALADSEAPAADPIVWCALRRYVSLCSGPDLFATRRFLNQTRVSITQACLQALQSVLPAKWSEISHLPQAHAFSVAIGKLVEWAIAQNGPADVRVLASNALVVGAITACPEIARYLAEFAKVSATHLSRWTREGIMSAARSSPPELRARLLEAANAMKTQ